MAFVFSSFGVVDNHALVAVAVRDIEFICFGVHESLGRKTEVFDVIAALARARLTDLNQELPFLGELHHHAVVVIGQAVKHRRTWGLSGSRWSARGCISCLFGSGGQSAAPIAAN